MSAFAKMTEPTGKSQVVRGMVPGDNVWAFNRVLLFFRVQQTENVKFAMRFGLHSDVFSHTGPITVSIRINGKPFAQETYSRPEEYLLEKPVPTGFLAADSLTEPRHSEQIVADRTPALAEIVCDASFHVLR